MPFTDAAREAVATLPAGDAMRVTLEFLLANAVGRENAVPWPRLRAHLKSRRVPMSKNVFQTSILKQTREGDVFIASSNRGYFLIADADDVAVMRQFYNDRIASEQARLRRLRRLTLRQGWD
jgi:hypothetical protein